MPTYDPTGHELLSPAAARLSEDVLAAEADAAESLLRRGATSLADTDFAADTPEYTRAVLAVVYQVNHQVERGGDLGEVKSWRRGERSVEYATGSGNGLISARAMVLLETLIPYAVDAGEWPIAGSLR